MGLQTFERIAQRPQCGLFVGLGRAAVVAREGGVDVAEV
jgi:hypothetical protein